MKEMTSWEIYRIMEELKDIEGSRIEKIYNKDKELRIVFSKKKERWVSIELLAAPGRIYITESERNMQEPTTFAMTLRKHLRNKYVVSVEQKKFDRVIEIKTDDRTLVLELFHRGNFILLDENRNIIMPLEFQRWKDRTLVPKEKYVLPKSINVLQKEEFKKALNTPYKVIVFLHTNGFGVYAEEFLNVEKDKPCNELTEKEKNELYKNMLAFIKKKKKPMVIFEKEKPIDAVPTELKMYKEKKKKEFHTFSRALDFFYSEIMKPEKKTSVLESQKKALEQLEKRKEELEKIIETINLKFAEFEELLEKIKKWRKRHGWKYVEDRIKKYNVKIDKNQGLIIFPFEPQIALKIYRPLRQTLDELYKKLKRLKRKEISATKRIVKITKTKKGKHWYEKFKYFFTSDGFLVVAGKDAKTNEELIKKYTNPNDIILHADIKGSPFVVIKTDKEVSKTAINEAAIFTGCLSKAWEKGFGAVDVFWVKPEQVDKNAPAGQYLSKGSFMIHGKRNYLTVELMFSIGITENGELIIGPAPSLSRRAKYFVTIAPGDEKDLGKRIKKRFLSMASSSMKELIKRIRPHDIETLVPFGKGRLVE